jgi:hypothetical protein
MTNKITKKLYNGEVEIDFYPDSHRYKKTGEKEYIPSVTSITGIIDKSRVLIYWAIGLTKDYLVEKFNSGQSITLDEIYEACEQHKIKKEEAASIGTQVHDWAERFSIAKTSGEQMPEIQDDFDDRVVMGINAFLDWYKEHDIKFIESERLVYSKTFNYCGLADAIVEINGEKILIDYKTAKGIYTDMYYQVAAYVEAYNEENEDKIKKAIIVHFNKETGEFATKEFNEEDLVKNTNTFIDCLNIKKREKELLTF